MYYWILLLFALSHTTTYTKASIARNVLNSIRRRESQPPVLIESESDSDGSRRTAGSEDSKVGHYDFEREERILRGHHPGNSRVTGMSIFSANPQVQLAKKRLSLKRAKEEIIRAQEQIRSLQQLIEDKRTFIKVTKAHLRKHHQLPHKK